MELDSSTGPSGDVSWDKMNKTCSRMNMSLPQIKSFEDLRDILNIFRSHGYQGHRGYNEHQGLFIDVVCTLNLIDERFLCDVWRLKSASPGSVSCEFLDESN